VSDGLWRDIRFSLRRLRNSPAFTATAVLTLALGIGASTAIFTLLNAVLYRQLPAPHPEQLVELRIIFHNGKHVTFSLPMFEQLQRGQKVFSGMFAWSGGGPQTVEIAGKLTRDSVLFVSGEYYSEFAQRPLLGRLIDPADSDPSKPVSRVAVISEEFWRNRFGGDAAVLGKQIRVEGQPFTVVGVTQRGFTGIDPASPPNITVPLLAFSGLGSPEFDITSSHYLWLHVIGRLKPGVTIQAARAQLSGIWPAILADVVPSDEQGERRQQYLSMGLLLTSAARGPGWDQRAEYWRPLYYLMGIVALLLLVVCVNLATLMLARGAGRMQEISVRLALGANPVHVAAQTLLEGLLLSIAGGVLGLAFAFWGTRWMYALLTRLAVAPVALDLRPDLRVLAFTGALVALTAIFFGLAPALRASLLDPARLLRQDSRTFSSHSGRLGPALIVTQVSLSLMLVLASALFTRSFWNLRSADPGFERSSVLNIWLLERPGAPKNFDLRAYYRELVERLDSIPGVRSASFAGIVPGAGAEPWIENVVPIAAPSVSIGPAANIADCTPGFFATIGMRILQGRDFAWTDGPQQPRVAIVSASLARRLFPQGNAIGAHLRIGTTPDYQDLEIVGLVNDARLYSPREAHSSDLFTASLQGQFAGLGDQLFVRVAQNPLSLTSAISQSIDSFGHQFAVRSLTLDEVRGQALAEERLSAFISSFFAAFALLLACLGVYGLISHSVARRTREIGVRVALGASARTIQQLVLRQALGLSLAGIILGVLGSLAASRLLSGVLYGISPNDAGSLLGVCGTLLFAGLLAGYLPARRATRIDPVGALRHP
jgi:predicted permease